MVVETSQVIPVVSWFPLLRKSGDLKRIVLAFSLLFLCKRNTNPKQENNKPVTKHKDI